MGLKQYIREAMYEALKSNMYHKHGAVIIYRNKIIGRGYNYNLGKDMRMKNGKWSVHAETQAINDCDDYNKLSDSTLIVVRISPYFFDVVKSGEAIHNIHHYTKESCPCPKCRKTIKKYKINRVLHS
jgi:deoxycytidylate deaminase